MAPSSKGTNPAPNYTVTMNRVQTQIEARLRIVRSFMPSRPAGQQSTSASTSHSITGTSKPPSFSALASTSTSKPNPPNLKKSRQQQTQRQDAAESLFAETRAQDPNAGLGFGGSSKRGGEKEKEKEKERANQILRSRLLGRKRGAGDRTSSRRGERSGDDDDEEEPGRSGLGRAKKRARREESREEEEEKEEEKEGEAGVLQPVTEPETLESASGPGKVGAAQSRDDGLRNATLEEGEEDGQGVAADSVPNSSEGVLERKKSKKRKRKKRKNKSEEAECE